MGSVALSVNALSKLIFRSDDALKLMDDENGSQDGQSGDDNDDSWNSALSGAASTGSDLVTSSTLLPGESGTGSGGAGSGSTDLVTSSTLLPGSSGAGSSGASSGSVDLVTSSTVKPTSGAGSSAGGSGSTSGSSVDLITSPTVNANTATDISVDQLKAIVEAKAPGAVITKMELGSNNGTLIYTVELLVGTSKYTMTVHATTGAVLTYAAGANTSASSEEDDDDEEEEDEEDDDDGIDD